MTTPRINGNLHSHASVKLKVGTTLITAFKSITYGDKIERSMAHAADPSFAPIGRTQGKYTPDQVVAEIEKGQAAELRSTVANLSGTKSFGSVEFEIVVSYETPERQLITDTITRCKIAAVAAKDDDGGDTLYDTLTFDTMGIKWNGLTLFEERTS